MATKLSEDEEKQFKSWYAGHAKKYNINPNPDDPRHFYDYRGAWKAGAKPDERGHLPDEWKQEGHPTEGTSEWPGSKKRRTIMRP